MSLFSKIGNAQTPQGTNGYSAVQSLGQAYSPSSVGAFSAQPAPSPLMSKMQNAAPQPTTFNVGSQGLSEGVTTGGNQIHPPGNPVSGYSAPFHTQYSPSAQQAPNPLWGKVAGALNQQSAQPMAPGVPMVPQAEAHAGSAARWQRMGSGWMPSQQMSQGSMPGVGGK